MIVVLDASVVISALLKRDGVPERALLLALAPGNVLAVSPDVEAEYLDVIARPKFDRWLPLRRRQDAIELVLSAATRSHPSRHVFDCADPSDNKYLALALECAATVVVTGDRKHLIPMSPWRNIPLLHPADFLAMHDHRT